MPTRLSLRLDLPVKSCVIDGEAILCNGDGLAASNPIRGYGRNSRAILSTFGLLEGQR
jgi:hypothetical protein